MKLIRFGAKGEESPGLLNSNNTVVDLKRLFPEIPDIGEEFFRNGWLDKVSSVDDPGQQMDVRIGCPVCRPSKIICLGKNYAEHAREGGFDSPGKPLIFCKSPNTLNGPFDHVLLPQSSGQVDWEVELAVIIGREGKRIKRKDAYEFVAGYAVMNDVSGRQAQFSDSQWYRGKSFDTFAPLGPAIVTKDEIGDVQNLRLICKVDGVIMQNGNTKDMIFDIPFIIENISEDITLLPGDIISTGTPSGVGIFRDPPVTLNNGSIVECTIEHIGTIMNKFVALKE
jgi:2-keto-4-pentenoate hydratase/2-oxohepta-3-ene-1,7-dioic acid hydratase in catechol pathway